jgi:toxin-antitoxin system PIN domain toxin
LILVDANILIYAHVGSFVQHEVAREWFDRQLSGVPRVGLPWASLLAFLRIVTNPRLFDRPEPMAAAWDQVRAWLACESVWVPEPAERHVEILSALLALPGVRGGLVPDAHLAALAMEHGLILCSADRDFAQFPGLRWMNPIVR